MSARPAVFLDRDGTLVEERSYPTRFEDLVPIPGVGAALGRLAEAGFLCIVLTNQSAVARGMLDEERLGELHAHLVSLLDAEGGSIDAVYYCPHHPDGRAAAYALRCGCRKPAPGLLELACHEHAIDLSRSAFVGDAVRDMLPGSAPDALRLLVRSGHALPPDAAAHADHVVADLPAAVELILEREAARAAAEDAPGATPSPPLADDAPRADDGPPAQGT